jgi:methyl-accepting chemotaxis protein
VQALNSQVYRGVSDVSIRLRLLLAISSLVFACMLVGIAGWFAKSIGTNSVEMIFRQILHPSMELKVVADVFAIDIVDTSHKVRAGTMSRSEAAALIRGGLSKAEESQQHLASDIKSDEGRLDLQRADELAKVAFAETRRFLTILDNGSQDDIVRYVEKDMYPAIEPLTLEIAKLSSMTERLASSVESETQQSLGLWVTLLLAQLSLRCLCSCSPFG